MRHIMVSVTTNNIQLSTAKNMMGKPGMSSMVSLYDGNSQQLSCDAMMSWKVPSPSPPPPPYRRFLGSKYKRRNGDVSSIERATTYASQMSTGVMRVDHMRALTNIAGGSAGAQCRTEHR